MKNVLFVFAVLVLVVGCAQQPHSITGPQAPEPEFTKLTHAQQVQVVQNWREQAAVTNQATLQMNLGLAYGQGLGAPKDLAQSCYWFSKAAAQGLAGAQLNLALCYLQGEGVEQSPQQALIWLKKSAQQNWPKAQYLLSFIYYEGKLVSQDKDQSSHWLEQAAVNGEPQAQAAMGWNEARQQHYQQAYDWYQKAAAQGVADAQTGLGLLYLNGNLGEVNLDKALDWFKQAALKNEVRAQELLANLYLISAETAGKADLNLAWFWFHKAAIQGSYRAQRQLGLMYRDGSGVDKNTAKAYLWLSLSLNQPKLTPALRDQTLAWLAGLKLQLKPEQQQLLQQRIQQCQLKLSQPCSEQGF